MKMAKQTLTAAVDKFVGEMKARLNEKKREGFTGWDEGTFCSCDIPRRLHDKTLTILYEEENCNPDDLIDIANFAMMLHKKISA